MYINKRAFYLFSVYVSCILLMTSTQLSAKQTDSFSYQQVVDEVYAMPSLTLTYGGHEANIIEVWKADAFNGTNVILVHGGCWMSEYDLKHVRPAASALQTQGFNVYSLEYRRTGASGGGWPTSMHDIEAAVDFLASNGHIDAQNSVIAGHSAGGHLALLLAQRQPQVVAGVIGLAPITDIALYALGESGCQRAAVSFMQTTPDQNRQEYRLANPKHFPLHPSTWLLFGSKDSIVGADQQQTFADAASAQQIVVDGAGHFDFIHLDSQAWSTFINTLKKVN